MAQIRRIEPRDYQALTLFFEENDRAEVTTHFHPFPLTAESARRITEMGGRDAYYIALLEQAIVGLCMLRGWDEGYVTPSFGVMVDYRRQGLGLGRQMTVFAIEEALRLGCSDVMLTVYASNERAVRLYDSLRFHEVKREVITVETNLDEKITMVKDLKL
ncbi:MAG: Mycothiol acetyltransferase [Gammaproteobacteria bacterium]|nr:Mycothiol acetyltransferase [Gammaproteobacteria bacterium]